MANVAKTKSSAAVNADLVISGIPTVAQLSEALATGTKFFFESSGTEADVVNRIANATTADDIFGGGDLLTPKNILGTRYLVQEIESARPSDYEESALGIYLVIKAVDPDGEVVKIAVGSTDGIAKLVKLNELGLLPRGIAFEQSKKPTASGYYPINLVDRDF